MEQKPRINPPSVILTLDKIAQAVMDGVCRIGPFAKCQKCMYQIFLPLLCTHWLFEKEGTHQKTFNLASLRLEHWNIWWLKKGEQTTFDGLFLGQFGSLRIHTLPYFQSRPKVVAGWKGSIFLQERCGTRLGIRSRRNKSLSCDFKQNG